VAAPSGRQEAPDVAEVQQPRNFVADIHRAVRAVLTGIGTKRFRGNRWRRAAIRPVQGSSITQPNWMCVQAFSLPAGTGKPRSASRRRGHQAPPGVVERTPAALSVHPLTPDRLNLTNSGEWFPMSGAIFRAHPNSLLTTPELRSHSHARTRSPGSRHVPRGNALHTSRTPLAG